MITVNAQGIRTTPTAIVSIVAALTSTTLYQITTDRITTARIVKVWAANRTGADVQLRIGETVAAVFTQRLPQLRLINADCLVLDEEQIPRFVFTSDIVAQSTGAGAAPNDVQVMIEVEEVR